MDAEKEEGGYNKVTQRAGGGRSVHVSHTTHSNNKVSCAEILSSY